MRHLTVCWGAGVEWDAESHRAWHKKVRHPGRNGVKMLLSGAEYCQLMEDAGITANDIGNKPHQYNLARDNDTGNYEVGNCRFITALENRHERKEAKMPHAAPIMADGVKYESQMSACRATGRSRGGVQMRLASENYPDWYRIK